MLAKKLMVASAAKPKLYVDDAFSTWLYTGNGSTQTITNGIDLAGEGGLVWTKKRNTATQGDHLLSDTARGLQPALFTNKTDAQANYGALQSFNSNGYTLTSDPWVNSSGNTFVSWTFRRAPKFFDIVTYTGNGVPGRQIPHGLGIRPGFVAVKSLDTQIYPSWGCWARINDTNAAFADGAATPFGFNTTNRASASTSAAGAGDAHDDNTFSTIPLGNYLSNVSGVRYVAYLWAHDPSEDGIVQCGSFTEASNVSVDLGWEPQFIIVKPASTAGSWFMFDSMRGWPVPVSGVVGAAQKLEAQSANPESSATVVSPTSTGFTFTTVYGIGQQWIYLAIRRPNKPPKSGTEVYNALLRTGSSGVGGSVSGVGFPPDAVFNKFRPGSVGQAFGDRLRGNSRNLDMTTLSAESDPGGGSYTTFNQDGVSYGTSTNVTGNGGFVEFFIRRAPGFHDQICYTGTGANKTEAHNLGKQPALWLAKRRNATGWWVWGSTLLNANEKIVMPAPNGRVTDATAWDSTYPTASNISLGTLADVNASGGTYTLYMWATLAGISKVGTYTGNGSSQTIDCGFTTGARFVMIIRMTASTAQDIYLWDSARGIVAGNDPRLSLHTTAAEVTGLDTVDVAATGFIVNQDASNVNVNGAQYLYLAIA